MCIKLNFIKYRFMGEELHQSFFCHQWHLLQPPACYFSTRIANEWEYKHSSATHIMAVSPKQRAIMSTDQQRPLKYKEQNIYQFTAVKYKWLNKIPLYWHSTLVWNSLCDVYEILYEWEGHVFNNWYNMTDSRAKIIRWYLAILTLFYPTQIRLLNW